MGFIYCAIYVSIIGILSFFLGRIIPKHFFKYNKFPFCSFKFENNGMIYEKIYIRVWQNKLPDMSKILPSLMPEKSISKDYKEKLPIMIAETCIAEFIHVMLSLLGLFCLILWPGIGGIVFTSVYIILLNLPFIIIQRYNRPRLVRLYNKILKAKIKNKPKKETEFNEGTDFNLQYR